MSQNIGDIKMAFGVVWIGMTLQAFAWHIGGFAIVSVLPIVVVMFSGLRDVTNSPSAALRTRPR